MQRYKCSTKEK